MKRLFILLIVLLPTQIPAADIAFMVIDGNSYLANQAVDELSPDLRSRIRTIASGELSTGENSLKDEIETAKIIVVDVMGRELEDFLSKNITLGNKTIYALRASADDERLKKQGFLFDSEVAGYYKFLSKDNIKNMLRLVIHRHLDNNISYEKVAPLQQLGIYHPKAPHYFTSSKEYRQWQAIQPGFDPARPRLGLLFFSSYLTPGQQEPIDTLIHRLEDSGFNVMACFGRDRQMVELLLSEPELERVDIVLSFSLKFAANLTPELAKRLKELDVPLLSAISLYKETAEEWRQSPVGIGGQEVAWTMASPEISGLIEPTVLIAKEKIHERTSAKTYYVSKLVEENVQRLIPRLHAWINLQKKANRDKKLAILFYNHHQGKQNIGASYLNVFASLDEIFLNLHKEGYITGELVSEEKIKSMILTSARNVGSWAPGELERMVQEGELVQLDMEEYKKWFSELPQEFRDKVVAQWGKPGEFTMMMHEGKIVIPMVRRGNVVMMPEPSRGWGDDPMKLYHDTTLYPHHQYIAAYLWLQKIFTADAMIHLGTHATYEWTPGKQAGLSPSCPPEVLITDIPNLYPYIVDDVGEAIQAKRRGRGVMLSHLTPMIGQSGLYEEYSRMAELTSEYERAEARNSQTAPLKLKELKELATKTGIVEDLVGSGQLDHFSKEGDKGLAEALSHYLEEIKDNLIPYGMHTYGRMKSDDEVDETAEAVVKWNPGMDLNDATNRIKSSADMEMGNLLHGLAGGFVEPGEGNDPLRNPGAIPTGRNLYGFNPAKLPSPAAWELGKKAADDIIRNHLEKHKKYPSRVAVVLWAVESLRNEGVNESTILWLMGIRPKWQKSGRVAGLEVVPGRELGRPRIDVMINASGLYRDLFPGKLEFLDEALQLALRQTDIDNLIAAGSARIKKNLLTAGINEEEAEELSRLRIFSEEPGSYGNGISEMASASGLWEKEREIVDIYENRMGFAFGRGRWGTKTRALFKESLRDVDVTVHSRSSAVYGLLDNDDMFQYLGGLSMAARLESGKTPETLITDQRKPGEVKVEDMALTLGREMRSRYLNPKWIKAMKKEDYAGARAMSHFVEYLWGWQVTTPDKVDAAKWQQSYEVYVEDKYGLELKEFFDKASPWAYQSVTGRMLEAVRKGYWQADEKVTTKCAVDYAVSVVEKGVACCDHTCNNPLLNQMVVSIISLPGVMSPEMVEKFKLAVEQAAQKSLDEQVSERKELQQQLTAPAQSTQQNGEQAEKTGNSGQESSQEIEGYKMDEMKSTDEATELSSSGVEWLAGLLVLAILALGVYGARRSTKQR